MNAKSVDDVLNILEKHIAYHSDFFREAIADGDAEDQISYASALAALKMLKIEIVGMKKW